MGLPGSGKTSLAALLNSILPNCIWYNADAVRRKYNDWDFSEEGRRRQACRMKDLADASLTNYVKYVICDFVAPTEEIRDIFNADYIIWMDTIHRGRFEDTNKIFIPPNKYNIRVTEQQAKSWADIIIEDINNINNK